MFVYTPFAHTLERSTAQMAYKQLTREERYQIHALKKAGNCTAEIARLLERHPSTISREIERNTGGNGYRPKQAQELTDNRRRNAAKAVKFTEKVRQYVDEKLRLQWSPEQISGRMERDIGQKVSHERIYQYLAADKKQGGTLWQNLRRSNRKRKKRYGCADNRGKIPNRVGIEKRPSVVDAKVRRGRLGGGHRDRREPSGGTGDARGAQEPVRAHRTRSAQERVRGHRGDSALRRAVERNLQNVDV